MQNKRDLLKQLRSKQLDGLERAHLADLKRSQHKSARMMWAAKSMLAVLGVLVLTVVFGAWNAASPLRSDHQTADILQRAQATPTGHKPGEVSSGPTVGKDVKNTATGKPHVCAGKKLLYKAHVDAIYGTYNKGKPDVMVVDGQQPVPADDVCLRLAPDAVDGREVSRIKVPNKKALSFLGKPGTVLWNAPQAVDFSSQWRPIWAGLGAFDPAHEVEVPKDFAEGALHFHMKKFSGPGNMEVFFHNSGTPTPERVLSTKDGLKDYDYEVGGHGHFNWTFSKAGLYQLTMAWDVKKSDGTTVKSAERTINWLVGSDKQVGLPEGTTTGLEKITKPVAPLDKEKPDEGDKPGQPSDTESTDPADPTAPTDPSDPTAPTDSTEGTDPTTGDSGDAGTGEEGAEEPTDPEDGTEETETSCETPKEVSDEEVRGEIDEAFGSNEGTERAVIPSGHMDLGVGTNDASDADPHTFLKDGADPANVQERESGSFIFLVNSPKAKVRVPDEYREELGKSAISLPQAQQENRDVPWLGFSTEHLNSAKEGVDLSIKDFEGPGRMVTLESTGLDTRLRLDSEHRENKLHYSVGAHNHQQFLFTKPGAYRVVFRYEGTTVDGKKFDRELETFFVIKDSCGEEGNAKNGKSGLEELQELQKHLDSENVKIGKYMDTIVGGIEALRGNNKSPQSDAKNNSGNTAAGGVGNGASGDGGASGTATGASSGTASGTSNEHSNAAGAASNGGASNGSGSNGNNGSGTGGGHSVSGGSTGGSSGAADVSSGSAGGDIASASDGGAGDAGIAEEAGSVEGEAAGEEAGGGGGIHRINAAQGQHNGNAAPAHSDGAQNVETKKTAAESFLDSLTSGGWTTGFLLGLGLMGLLGGALLFFVAARNMQRAHTMQLLQAYREISRDRAEQAYAEGTYEEDGWAEGQER